MRTGMRFGTVAGALIMSVALSHTEPSPLDRGVSPEIEEALAEIRFERPASRTEKQQLVKDLQRRGVETVTDLRPYLRRSEIVRQNALTAMEQLGHIDTATLGLIRDLVREARDSNAPSVSMGVRIFLENSEWPEAVQLAGEIVTRSNWQPLLEIMVWLSERDQELLGDMEDVEDLNRACLHRMASLFETGTYSGEQPLSFSMAVERPPFNDSAYVNDVAEAFLLAVRNSHRMQDLEKIGFISSFTVLRRAAKVAPQRVEGGLTKIAATASEPLVRLILWRMAVDGLSDTKSGKRVTATALKRYPSLAGYAGRLNRANRGVAGTGDLVEEEIDRSLRELKPAGEASPNTDGSQ